MLRESIRRSIRQIRDMTTPVHSPGNTLTSMAELERGQQSTVQLPPDYTSVILEMQDNPSSSTESDAASTSNSSTPSETNHSNSSDSSGSLLNPAELTRLLRDSFRRSARNTLRNSLRFLRGEKSAPKPGSPASGRSGTDDDETTDTDQGTRQLVHGAVRIHRDPSLSNVVVTLPNSDGDHSESVA